MPRSNELTPREIQVAMLLRDGRRNLDIAAELGISEQTVKFHVSRIMIKLDADNRTHAAAKIAGMRIGPSTHSPVVDLGWPWI